MPQISIVIPLYNKEQFINGTIQSILRQDFDDFEIVVINDGSKDGSCQVVNSIKDDRIHLFTQENQGVSATRNNGIKKSNGKYVFFLDADDTLSDHALSVLYKAAENNPEADIVVAGFNYRNNDGKIVRVFKNEELGYLKDPFKSIWLKRLFFRTGNILIRKSFLSDMPLFNEQLTIFEDYDWLFHLLREARVYSISDMVLDYNRYEGGLSTKRVKISNDYASVIIPKECKNKYENKLNRDFLIRRFVVYFKNKDYQACRCILQKLASSIFRSLF